MRIGIYPGTFDPITLLHIDVIKKSLKLVDILNFSDARSHNINKEYFLYIKMLLKFRSSLLMI